MCGIAGLYNFGASARDERDAVTAMRDAMSHRGPDDAGLWASADNRVVLGHRRLSIVDLSAAGHQPMSNEDGTVWITFNGEIYNHADLRPRAGGARATSSVRAPTPKRSCTTTRRRPRTA